MTARQRCIVSQMRATSASGANASELARAMEFFADEVEALECVVAPCATSLTAEDVRRDWLAFYARVRRRDGVA